MIKEIEDVIEPFNGRRIPNLVLLTEAYPEIAAEWCYKKNCGFGPEDFSRSSGVKVFWKCPICKLDYKAQISNRTTSKSTCPYCAHKAPCHFNCLATLNPHLIKEWHPTKNGKLTPSDVTNFSKKKVWWQCSSCKYAWQATVQSRTAHHTGCTACYLRIRELYPIIFYEWHVERNGGLTAARISRSNKEVVWWKCLQKHEWQASISSRTRDSFPCPECTNSRREPQHQLRYRARRKASNKA